MAAWHILGSVNPAQFGSGYAPVMGRYLDIPVLPDWRSTDSVDSMYGIMREHERGMFMRSALLVEEMMTDDRISGVLATRIGGLLCAELTFKPADDRKRSLKLARILGGSDESNSDGEWLRILDFDTAFDLLKWKIMLGVAVAEIVWDTRGGEWLPRLNVWHPRHLWWNWGTREFYLATQGPDPLNPVQLDNPEYLIKLPRTDLGQNRGGHWFVWGRQNSWLNGAVRPLGMKYLDRVWNERDWARYCEKHGMAIIEGKVPSGEDAEKKALFENDVSTLNNEGVIITPQGRDGEASYGIQLHEATARSWETFKARKETLDTDIAICLLGQNLSTEVQGGSFAAASVHEGIRIDKKRQDANLYKEIREQVLIPWVESNLGAGKYADIKGRGESLAPYPQAHIEPPEDEESEANALKLLGEAVQALVAAYPAVDKRAILETAGVPIDEDLAAALEEAERNPPRPPVASAPGTPTNAPANGPGVASGETLPPVGTMSGFGVASLSFDPNQPRDDHGMWTGEGGGGSGGSHGGNGSSGGGHRDFSSPGGGGPSASREWEGKASEGWSKSLSSDERDAIQSYTSSGYHEINESLRSGGKKDPRVKDLDSAIGKSTIPEDVVVYRGGAIDQRFAKAGSVVQDKAFVSTSLQSYYAESYGHRLPTETRRKLTEQGKEVAIWKINVKKGSKGAVLGKESSNLGEGEVMLPRGSKFKVTKVERRPYPQPAIIHAELVGAK